jgi:hypothetical protein
MKYQCIQCKKSFSQKFNYDRHMSRIRPCIQEKSIKLLNNDTIRSEIIKSDIITNIHQTPPKLHQTPPKLHQIPPKIPLLVDNDLLLTTNNKLLCEKCNIIFSRCDALKRHTVMNRCKANKINNKKNDYDILNEKYQQIQEENKKIRQEFDKFKDLMITSKKKFSKNKTINNNDITNTNNDSNNTINNYNLHNTTNNTNSNNIIINIVDHGDEDLSKLITEELKLIFCSSSDAILTLLKILHFNERLPEYQNIFINNLNSPNMHLYEDGNFIACDKKTTIHGLINRMATAINVISKQNPQLLSKHQPAILAKLYDWLSKFDIVIEDINGNMIKASKKLMTDYKKIYLQFEYILYNNNSMITNKIKALAKIQSKIIPKATVNLIQN